MVDSTDKRRESGSVTHGRGGITVAPSPLNGVKLELAVVLAVAVTLYALIEAALETGWLQVSILAVYGLAACLWLVNRARKAVERVRDRSSDGVS